MKKPFREPVYGEIRRLFERYPITPELCGRKAEMLIKLQRDSPKFAT